MRAVAVALVIGCTLGSIPAQAQPSPAPAVTVAFARELAADYAKAVKRLAQQTTFAGRVSARRDIARVLKRGVEGSQGFRLPMEPNADSELRRLAGFGFDELQNREGRAWEACAHEVRTGHGLDDAARECLEAVWPIWIAKRHVLVPPPAFENNPAGADGSSKLYAATVAELAAKPKSREVARRLAAMALATTDHATAAGALAPFADGYDEVVTEAEAYRALARGADAERLLRKAIAQAPHRPEAHHALALLLADRMFASRGTLQDNDAIRADAWRHILAYLCLRDRAVLPAPPRAFEEAADLAEQLDRGIHGNGSHWSWRSDTPQPLPFLPNAVLPPRYQAVPSVQPARNCNQAVAAALQKRSPKPATMGVTEQRHIAAPSPEPRRRPELPVPPARNGCAGCALVPARTPPAWALLLVAIAISLKRASRCRASRRSSRTPGTRAHSLRAKLRLQSSRSQHVRFARSARHAT